MSKRDRKAGRRTGKYNVLPEAGITIDNRKVIAGVYEFHETYGMPLEVLFAYLYDNNMVPDWVEFYKFAQKNNMTHERILFKIKDPLEDTYGVHFADEVCKKLTEIFVK